MIVYVVRVGSTNFDGVEYEDLVGFTTNREAQTVLRERQRVDPYGNQYDDVVKLHVYRTRAQWKNGIRQRAKRRTK